MLISFFNSAGKKKKKTVGKEEIAVYQHFLIFLQCFNRASFSGSLKVGIVY